jgi:hypothetical protein
MKPQFITFTGADDATSIESMAALSARYPIEWAILFSPSRQGKDPRYPGVAALGRLSASGLRLAAHLCGDYARDVVEGRDPEIPVMLGSYARLQINHAAPNPEAIAAYSKRVGVPCIAQARGETFPDDTSISWLFDASGGRGIAPKAWPRHPGRTVGYAGGIGPDNVASSLAAIAADGPYWIDMESGVRTGDLFNLDLVAAVCEEVYR